MLYSPDLTDQQWKQERKSQVDTSTQTPPVVTVIGTAGHVDHGKTTLVGSLSGVDTDRLKEEKLRGISIELGFAWLDLPVGRVAIIDVPGHERFVRQMIAGAAGVDIVLLVVAADEGVMPQTREHLDICQILGVKTGAIIVTKSDLVDPDWLELVMEDTADAVKGTFLEGAPVLSCSAQQPDTLDAVRSGITTLVEQARSDGTLNTRSPDRPFKMSVDRVFTIKGFGTVATGTAASGTLKVGDPIEIMPHGAQARVRGLQVHEVKVDEVLPGQRAAINLQGVEHQDLGRGDVIASPGGLMKTSMFDGTFRALARLDDPIADRSRVLVHVGTAQIQGTLALIDAEEVMPGEEVRVQIRLDAPTSILPGEPFIVRGFAVLSGYGKTLGGGLALTPASKRHRGTSSAAKQLIDTIAQGIPEDIVARWVCQAGETGVELSTIDQRLPLTKTEIRTAWKSLVEAKKAFVASQILFHQSPLEALAEKTGPILDTFHTQHPALPGMSTDELRTRLRAALPAEVFQVILSMAITQGHVTRTHQTIARKGFNPSRTQTQQDNVRIVLDTLVAGNLKPPRLQDLPDDTGLTEADLREAIQLVTMDGMATRVNRDFIYATECLDRLKRDLVQYLETHGSIETPAFKELTDASRKYTIPLGEYFDRINLTIRVGDSRRLRGLDGSL